MLFGYCCLLCSVFPTMLLSWQNFLPLKMYFKDVAFYMHSNLNKLWPIKTVSYLIACPGLEDFKYVCIRVKLWSKGILATSEEASHGLKKTQNVAFNSFKNSPKLTIFDIFNQLLSTQNVKIVNMRLFEDFQTLWASANSNWSLRKKLCNIFNGLQGCLNTSTLLLGSLSWVENCVTCNSVTRDHHN